LLRLLLLGVVARGLLAIGTSIFLHSTICGLFLVLRSSVALSALVESVEGFWVDLLELIEHLVAVFGLAEGA